MSNKKLIGIYSPAPQSGKSTLADHLVERHGFTRVKFAGALKAMIRTLLIEAGVATPEDVDRYIEGDLKETFIPALSASPRRLMQTLGTEWGRGLDENFWVRLTMAKVAAIDGNVVIDDLRFRNELEALDSARGLCIRVTRPDASLNGTAHCSEGALEGVAFDINLLNVGTVPEYLSRADKALTL